MDRLATALPADAIGCSSHATARVQQRMRPRRATFVVYPGMDLPPVPGLADRDRIRQQLNVARDRAVVGVMGRLQPSKGQHRFLEALSLLLKEGHNVHGLMIGGDAYELSPHYLAYLQGLIAELDLGRNVTMTGQVDNPLTYLAATDVLISPTEDESFGIGIVEAMALGVPVVACNRGGPAEIVQDGRSGLLTADAQPASIAAALRRLLPDRDLRLELAAAGRKRAVECFGAERMTHELEGALLCLADVGR